MNFRTKILEAIKEGNVEDKCLRFAMSGTYHAGEKGDG